MHLSAKKEHHATQVNNGIIALRQGSGEGGRRDAHALACDTSHMAAGPCCGNRRDAAGQAIKHAQSGFQEASSPSDLGAGQQVRCPCMCNALVGLQVAGVNVDGISGRQRPLVLQKADVEVQGLQFQWQEAANA